MSDHKDLIARLRTDAAIYDNGDDIDSSQPMRDAADLIERVIGDLPQDAIDGGWTALSISKYAKGLEARAGEAKPIYQVTEDDGAWHDTDWLTYQSTAEGSRRVAWTHPPIGDAGKGDEARLSFVIDKQALIVWRAGNDGVRRCQLYQICEYGTGFVLSGKDRWFDAPRQAIDAAIASLTKQADGEKQS
ncbi:hypothetical protein QYH69_32395 [Paraburkholderia sp. SARCC-3016]|uniref:hypothetical protein n=1 Tax=Paraburkholderia sp. SARCC-3016 TaxID=3058611 RepID=UPI0028076A6B|nr:hypothetical protein [Paraburkholderia sp. SARCC-3016]MDQ7981925.1 hypothetical protein [Paraburkholderia sp. SARCC-3016]